MDWSIDLLRHPGITFISCPECKSLHVVRHDNGKSAAMCRWVCNDCNHGWKIPKDVVAQRCYVVLRDGF